MKPTLFFLCLAFLFLFSACEKDPGNESGQLNIENNGDSSAANVPTEKYVKVAGGELYTRSIGTGEVIVMVHGGPGLDHSYFLPWTDLLSLEHQLIYFDQRYSGKSKMAPGTSKMSLKTFAHDLDSVRSAYGVDKIHVLGHSWGGLIAMQYAILYPQYLKSLILSNSMAASTAFRQQETEILNSRRTRYDSLEQAAILASEEFQRHENVAFEALFRLMFKQEFFDTLLLDQLNLTFPSTFYENSKAFMQMGEELNKYDLHPQLAGLETPTLIIYGDWEPLTLGAGPALKKALRFSKYRIIPDCGHFPFIEKPNSWLGEITRWVRDPYR